MYIINVFNKFQREAGKRVASGRRRMFNPNTPITPFTLAKSPDSEWTTYTSQKCPYDDQTSFTSLKPAELPSTYRFLISAVIPRPIAFISTLSTEGVPNVAPYSYFNVMSHDPPLLVFSCVIRSTGAKDTLRNVLDTKECVVNIISEWYLESANHCAGEFPFEVDEFDVSGLIKLESDEVKPFRVAQAGVQMECKLRDTMEIKNDEGKHTTTICVVEMVKVHVKPEIYNEERGTIDPEKYKAMGRIGGITYTTLGGLHPIPRPPSDAYKK